MKTTCRQGPSSSWCWLPSHTSHTYKVSQEALKISLFAASLPRVFHAEAPHQRRRTRTFTQHIFLPLPLPTPPWPSINMNSHSILKWKFRHNNRSPIMQMLKYFEFFSWNSWTPQPSHFINLLSGNNSQPVNWSTAARNNFILMLITFSHPPGIAGGVENPALLHQRPHVRTHASHLLSTLIPPRMTFFTLVLLMNYLSMKTYCALAEVCLISSSSIQCSIYRHKIFFSVVFFS